ncbi:MAG: DUF2066 domain-containing protein [Gammaproteobacteria bacterium]|nr:DUF2066 domain-containing protein [Gammaproteobacteria bacterium]
MYPKKDELSDNMVAIQRGRYKSLKIKHCSKVFCGQTTQMLVLFALLFAGKAMAVNVDGLYKVEIPVESQRNEEREAAIQKAMELMLIRVTGNSQVMLLPEIPNLLAETRKYIRQFRYARASESGIPAFGANASDQVLRVVFDEKSVKEALWKAGLPVWSNARPATLVWIAIQDTDRRYLLDANEGREIVAVIDTQAKNRGIPLLYPLLDLEDQVNIKVSDVWGGFSENIVRASGRYPAEEIFYGRIFLDPFGNWQARWTLVHGEQTKTWESTGVDMSQVLEEGVWGLADNIAARYTSSSVAGADQGVLRMRVGQVKNIRDLVRATRYLESLAQISRMQLSRVEADQVTYQIELRSDQQALSRAISLGQVLAEDGGAISGEGTSLAYRLMQ